MVTALKRTPGTALHRQLFVILRDRIVRGVYEPASMIPTEDELGAEFDVSRITVRRAVTDLETLGLVEKRPGRGTFVTHELPVSRASATLGLLDSLRQTANETKADVLSVGVEVAPREIARQLEIEDGAKALRAVRLRRAGAMPVMLTESWVNERFAGVVTAKALRKLPLYQLLMENGVEYDRVVQEVTAIAADPAISRYLEAEIASPLIKMTRLMYDVSGKPVQHLTVIFAPERSRLLMEYSIGAVNTLDAGSIYHDADKPKARAGTAQAGTSASA